MDVIRELSNALPDDALILGAENTRPFECDGLSIYRQKPLAVVLPHDAEMVAKILSICKKYHTPIVCRGAGTGLSGGALPLEDGVVLGFSRLDKIKKIDAEAQIAIVEPGVRNLAISDAAAAYGLYYAPDPSSQIACTIGGNVAENSGGVHCLKYGLTVHNLVAVKMLDANGETMIFHRDDPGPGLLALITGSEGLLGIIVEITVKLTPLPKRKEVVMASFDKVSDCAAAVAEIIKAGVIPAGLEMMDKYAISAAEDFVHVGYPKDAGALLLCELDGEMDAVEKEWQAVRKILSNAKHIRLAKNDTERAELWRGRKSAFPAVGRLSPDYYCMDGTIPKRHLAGVLEKIEQLSKSYNLRVANVFHAGDGNLHPLILYDANIEGEIEKTEKFGEDILKICLDVGGTITGEHGVGVEKLNSMCEQFNADELNIFHQIKKVFDPQILLNPGKAVPTLNRCAELGRMHVHDNQLPHPELPRF